MDRRHFGPLLFSVFNLKYSTCKLFHETSQTLLLTDGKQLKFIPILAGDKYNLQFHLQEYRVSVLLGSDSPNICPTLIQTCPTNFQIFLRIRNASDTWRTQMSIT